VVDLKHRASEVFDAAVQPQGLDGGRAGGHDPHLSVEQQHPDRHRVDQAVQGPAQALVVARRDRRARGRIQSPGQGGQGRRRPHAPGGLDGRAMALRWVQGVLRVCEASQT
jgi:hypothetical protein